MESIENNCILAQLSAFAGFAAPALGHINTSNALVAFVTNIKKTFGFFRAYNDSRGLVDSGRPYNKDDTKAVQSITEMVAANEEAKLGLASVEYKGTKTTTTFSIGFNSSESQKINSGARKYIEDIADRGHANHPSVVMQFFQINVGDFKERGYTGDRAIVQSLYGKPLPVFFASDIDRRALAEIVESAQQNPLQLNFLADVFLESNVSGKPVAYRVIKLHGVIPDESDEIGAFE